jgi:hypothetical protein
MKSTNKKYLIVCDIDLMKCIDVVAGELFLSRSAYIRNLFRKALKGRGGK